MLKDTKANKIFLIILVLVLASSFSFFKGWERRGIQNRGQQQLQIQADDILNIRTISNDIIIKVDTQAKAATISLGSNDEGELKITQKGNQIDITVNPIQRWFLRFFSYDASPLIITVPTSGLKELNAESTSGDIRLMQEMQIESADIASISGMIDFLGLQGSQTIKLHTISGEISGKDIVSKQRIEIASTSGEIWVQRLSAQDILLKSISSEISGDITLQDTGRLEAKTTSGTLSLHLIDSKDLTVTASTISGDIIFNGATQDQKKAELTTGKAENKVTLSSVSGKIDLEY